MRLSVCGLTLAAASLLCLSRFTRVLCARVGVACVCLAGLSLRTLVFVKDSPQRPPPANRQPPPTTNRQPPPTATNRPSPTATNRHQPPTANRRQPPNTVQYRFCGLVSCPCLAHEAEGVPTNVRFCWRYEPPPPPRQGQPWCIVCPMRVNGVGCTVCARVTPVWAPAAPCPRRSAPEGPYPLEAKAQLWTRRGGVRGRVGL